MNKSKRPGRQASRIKTERDRLNAILDSMDDGIYIVSRDYRIEFMNRALRRDLGEGEGQLCHQFFGQDPASCEHCQHGIGSFGPEFKREWYSESTRRSYEILVSPIHEPDGSISRLHILRDITERKALEAQLKEYSAQLEAKVTEQTEQLMRRQRLALLGEIAAGLAHEIRTPLGALITGIKLLEKEGRPPQERELVVGLLRKEIVRLDTKVSDFLTYAKPRLPVRKPCSIEGMIMEVKALLETDRDRLGETRIQLEVQQDLPDWPLDRDQIKEVLLNIGINALQALGGSGKLGLEARRNQNLLEIFVRDNGPGIPPEALPRVFQPFYSRRPCGTGLGLAIAKELVEAHGGRILVTSVAHLYTVFRILLPRKVESTKPSGPDRRRDPTMTPRV